MPFLYYLLSAIQGAPWESNNLEERGKEHVLFVGCGDYIRCALEINTGFGIFDDASDASSGSMWIVVGAKTICHLDFTSSYLTQVNKIHQSGDKGIYTKKCMHWFWFGKPKAYSFALKIEKESFQVKLSYNISTLSSLETALPYWVLPLVLSNQSWGKMHAVKNDKS